MDQNKAICSYDNTYAKASSYVSAMYDLRTYWGWAVEEKGVGVRF